MNGGLMNRRAGVAVGAVLAPFTTPAPTHKDLVMLSNAPARDLLDDRLAKLRSTAKAIEHLADEYHSAIRPVREALQAVADAPLADRDRWADAVSALACRLAKHGMAEVPASLNAHKRWARQDDTGRLGYAFAGREFCAALAAAITDGSLPAGFFDIFDQHSFVKPEVAALEVCNVLSRLLHVHIERTAPRFTDRYQAILAAAGMDGGTLRARLEHCGFSLSGEAVDAMHDWHECISGIPFYGVALRPPADCATATDKMEGSEGEKPDATESLLPVLLSAPDIAKLIDQKRESVTSFLTRFAARKPDCRIENETKRKNEPRYLYRTADVWPALNKWLKDKLAD